MNKFSYLVIGAFFLLTTCVTEPGQKEQYTIQDYNIVISPDLSNRINTRLYPKPIHDTTIIADIVNHTEDILGLKNRRSNQNDIYKIDFINRGILNNTNFDGRKMKIDFAKFKNQSERIDYLRHGLQADKGVFSSELRKIYDYSLINQSGSDVWNYLNETLKMSLLDCTPYVVQETRNEIFKKQNVNVVLLLTDGYLESANRSQGYRLDPDLITKIRKDYKTSGESDLANFIHKNPKYTINKTNFDLKDVNIFIGELVDRSLDKNGASREQPTDFQIIKVVWEKWLKDSGCKNVKIIQTVNTKEQFYAEFKDFLERI